jgi:hypothetical protein
VFIPIRARLALTHRKGPDGVETLASMGVTAVSVETMSVVREVSAMDAAARNERVAKLKKSELALRGPSA